MDDYFGESVAAGYDSSLGDMGSTEVVGPAVERLVELAGGGAALEFAIGTGRIALPLARRGVPVTGIDLSRAMVERLRGKPGGRELPVTIGDFSRTRVPGEFAVVYLVFNTIGNLTSQDAQVDCFANAAAHLRPGGHFVIETGVPPLRLLPPGQNAVPFDVTEGHLGFDTIDPATQEMVSHHVTVRAGENEYLRVPFRYVWPAELDLMARMAGMRLVERWSGWRGEPFDGESTGHVSVWRKS